MTCQKKPIFALLAYYMLDDRTNVFTTINTYHVPAETNKSIPAINTCHMPVEPIKSIPAINAFHVPVKPNKSIPAKTTYHAPIESDERVSRHKNHRSRCGRLFSDTEKQGQNTEAADVQAAPGD